MTNLKIGVVGYSGQKFDERKARQALNRLFDQASGGRSDVTVVSGLADLGIPRPRLPYRGAARLEDVWDRLFQGDRLRLLPGQREEDRRRQLGRRERDVPPGMRRDRPRRRRQAVARRGGPVQVTRRYGLRVQPRRTAQLTRSASPR